MLQFGYLALYLAMVIVLRANANPYSEVHIKVFPHDGFPELLSTTPGDVTLAFPFPTACSRNCHQQWRAYTVSVDISLSFSCTGRPLLSLSAIFGILLTITETLKPQLSPEEIGLMHNFPPLGWSEMKC